MTDLQIAELAFALLTKKRDSIAIVGGFLLNMDISEAGNMFRGFCLCLFGTNSQIWLQQPLLKNLLAGHIS